MFPLRCLLPLFGLLPITCAGAADSFAFAFSARPELAWSFWRGETPNGYRQKMADTVLPLVAVPNRQTQAIEFLDPNLPDQMERDRAPWPFHQHLCRLADADWLIALRVADSRPVFSPWQGDLFVTRHEVPSAHWPELYWIRYDCKTNQRETGRPILSPRKEDHFVFETKFKNHALMILRPLLVSPP